MGSWSQNIPLAKDLVPSAHVRLVFLGSDPFVPDDVDERTASLVLVLDVCATPIFAFHNYCQERPKPKPCQTRVR